MAGRFAVQRDLWIGFSDASVEGTFTWASGAPFAYQNWASGEPNDCSFVGCFSEDYGQMYQDYGGGSHGKWNDLGIDNTLNGVVEVAAVPEPSSLALLGIGAATLIRRRRQRTSRRVRRSQRASNGSRRESKGRIDAQVFGELRGARCPSRGSRRAELAEREGFEPSVPGLPAHVISSHADSTTLASLRWWLARVARPSGYHRAAGSAGGCPARPRVGRARGVPW